MKSTGKKPVELFREWSGFIVTIVGGILALIFGDNPTTAAVSFVLFLFLALAWWYYVFRKSPKPAIGSTFRLLGKRISAAGIASLLGTLVKDCWVILRTWVVLLIIIVIAVCWGLDLVTAMQIYSEPQFEITALDTLEADRNAYEVTDQLLWHYDELSEFGIAITFTLEIVPKYSGNQEFGKVVAIISGDGDITYEKELWPHFDSDASTGSVQLTLEELVRASGLQKNSHPPINRFRLGDPFFQQAELVVQIARAADKGHPWTTEHIVVRNAPWEFQSALIERDGQRALDVFVKNLGGPGDFTVRYRLVRLKREIDPSSNFHEINGTISVAGGSEPDELVHLERRQFFTDTIFLTRQLAQGRYLVEAYAVKKQNYAQFTNPDATWRDLDSWNSHWLFGEYPSNRHVFVVTSSEFQPGEIVREGIDIRADQSWQDTGVHVQQEDRIIILQVGGAWSMFESDVGFHDADGVKDWFGAEASLPDVCLGTLVARVGTSNDNIFQVGSWIEHTSQAEGNLYLTINDQVLDDNAGRITVQIITPAEK